MFKYFKNRVEVIGFFTNELKSHHIGYLYQLVLDLKQCDLIDPPYLNSQISDPIDLEEDVQYLQNLLGAEHKVYTSVAKNEQYAKVKHFTQFYANYR